MDKNFELHYNNSKQALNKVTDPINRHMRRHPKQYAKNESTIFSDIKII